MPMELQGFTILENLGYGPISSVWKARQISLDRTVLLKVLKQKLITRPGEVHPVIKEAGAVAKIKHPNLVPLYDVAREGAIYYLVVEFVSGQTIRSIMEKNKDTFTPKSTLAVAAQVAEAIGMAWETSRLTHRAINPDNIFLEENGSIKIADLGLPKLLDAAYLSQLLKSPNLQGKFYYAAPEQIKCSTALDLHTDMYGLGATMYFMLTGKDPFGGLPAREVVEKILSSTIPHPSDVNRTVPHKVGEFIARMMMKDPAQRPSSWKEVLAETQSLSPAKKKNARIIAQPRNSSAGHPAGSTIAAPAKPESPPPPRLKVRVRRSTSSEIESDAQKPELHAGIRFAIWSAMLMLWFLIAKVQSSLPPLPSYRESDITTSAKPPSHPRIYPPKPASSSSTIPQQTKTTAASPQPAPPPASPTESTDNENLEGFHRTIAQRVLAGEIETALALIDTELDYPHSVSFIREMDSIRNVLQDASRSLDLLIGSLHNSIGREISVREGNAIRRMIVRSVKEQSIMGEIMEQSGRAMIGRPATIPVWQLDPSDVRRLTGSSSSSSPGVAVFQVAWALKRGDKDLARRYAFQCGPLAPLLSDLLTSQEQGTDQ